MTHATANDLASLLQGVRAAPKDDVPVEQLCFRPGYGERMFPDALTLTRAQGIPDERWAKAPWMRLADGRPDPRIQVSILSRRVMDAVWHDRDNTVHPGDTIIADLDTSEANLPAGARLQVGTAVIEVSDLFNEGCVKWKARYGAAAKDWITLPENRPLRLRGLLCRIVEDGRVSVGDRLIRL